MINNQDYAAFGARRNHLTGTGSGTAPSMTTRGYTGHEHVESVGVIHMNGRIFDPALGRFLQVDPFIQDPTNPQSWNAYTYVFNNPMRYTDPSGMLGVEERQWLGAIVAIVAIAAGQSWLSQATFSSTMMANAAMVGVYAAAGAAAGAISTQSLRGGLLGAMTSVMTAGMGSAMAGANPVMRIGMMALTGGVMARLQGGDFGSAFLSAGLTAGFMPRLQGISNDIGRTLVGALVGGTISELSGGKFANGAINGAIQAAMMGRPTVVYGGAIVSGSSGGSYIELAKDKATHVETMMSSLDGTGSINSFGDSVHSRIQELTSETGYEYSAAFSQKQFSHPITGELRTIYAANISTSGSPVVAAPAILAQTGFRYMRGFDIHSHGTFMRGYEITKLDALYLAENGVPVSVGDRPVGRVLRKVNDSIDLLRPSPLDLSSPSGGFLSTPKGLKVYGP